MVKKVNIVKKDTGKSSGSGQSNVANKGGDGGGGKSERIHGGVQKRDPVVDTVPPPRPKSGKK